jgi:hypothetical protein
MFSTFLLISFRIAGFICILALVRVLCLLDTEVRPPLRFASVNDVEFICIETWSFLLRCTYEPVSVTLAVMDILLVFHISVIVLIQGGIGCSIDCVWRLS